MAPPLSRIVNGQKCLPFRLKSKENNFAKHGHLYKKWGQQYYQILPVTQVIDEKPFQLKK